MGTSKSWTPERRLRQRQAIKRWRPWEKSTGPRTREGKAIASQNAKRSPAQILEVLSGLEDELARLDLKLLYEEEELRAELTEACHILEKRIVRLENVFRARKYRRDQEALLRESERRSRME